MISTVIALPIYYSKKDKECITLSKQFPSYTSFLRHNHGI